MENEMRGKEGSEKAGEIVNSWRGDLGLEVPGKEENKDTEGCVCVCVCVYTSMCISLTYTLVCVSI